MPPLDCAIAIDAVLVAMGQAPLVLTAALAAVGYVPFALPAGELSFSALHILLANQAKEAGDVTAFLAETLSTGRLPSADDAEALMVEVDQMLSVGVAMRSALAMVADIATSATTRGGISQ
jgi:hypothetical protein